MDTIDFRAIVQQLPSSSMWTRSTGAPISGYAALVGEHPHRDGLPAHDVDEILHAAGRAADLTRQLLAQSS